MELLTRLPYPGNIRELKNLVERAMLMSGNTILTSQDISRANNIMPQQTVQQQSAALTLDEGERMRIVEALQKYGGNMTQVAAALGISRQALYRRLEKYGLKE